MGLCSEYKNKHIEIMKTNPVSKIEEKQEKTVNTKNTYDHIKSIVMENYVEKTTIKKSKNNIKSKVEIGIYKLQ